MKTLESRTHMSWRRATPVAVLVAVIGIVAVTMTFAATAPTAYEPEGGALSAGAARAVVSGASGGSVLKFATPVPGAFQANCIVKPSVCGYPDETNTGVPTGTVLKKVPSQVTSGTGWAWDANNVMIRVTGAGAILDSLDIAGSVDILANNVTISKTRITSGDYYPIRYFDNNNTGLLITDTEIAGTNGDVTSSVAFENYTLRRANIHGGADGLKANTNVTIEDSYIHELHVTASSHNDGIQSTGGGNNVTVRHNTCKLGDVPGANACMQMGNEDGVNTGWLVTNNLFDGGGWSINSGGNDKSMTYSNNRFTRNAGYGPTSAYGAGVTWTGNYYDDNNAPVNN